MKKWIVLGSIAALAACDVPQAPLVTGPDGQTRIQINTAGLTCYETRCLEIDPTRRSLRSIGNRRIRIPGNIDVSDGTVTIEEFKQMGVAASLAGGEGSGRDRG